MKKFKFFAFKRKENFLTENERKLFYKLVSDFEEYNNSKYYVLTQVRVSDLIIMKRYNIKYYGSVDFVICDYNEMKPLFCIELNGHEHEKNWFRRKADERKKMHLKKHEFH